jgi:hypothetical protein
VLSDQNGTTARFDARIAKRLSHQLLSMMTEGLIGYAATVRFGLTAAPCPFFPLVGRFSFSGLVRYVGTCGFLRVSRFQLPCWSPVVAWLFCP